MHEHSIINKKSFPPLENPEFTIRRRTRVDPNLLNDLNIATNGNSDDVPPAEGGDLPVPDLRTMEELCQPTLNGQGGPITSIAIQAMNFGLKNDMIQQVQNSCQFHGLSGDDANKHLDKFLHVSQSIKVNGVTDDALRLYIFPHSLIHYATAWFDRLLRNSITTFEQMAKMFLEKYFPPYMVTKLRNKSPISVNVPMTTVGQTQNVYAAGAYIQGGNSYQPQGNRNFLSYHLDNCLGPPGFNQSQNRSNPNQNYQNCNQGNNHGNAQGNNQGRTQFFQGASHGQNPPPAYQAPAYQALGYQAPVQQASIPQPQVMTTTEFTNYIKSNDAILKNMQMNMTSLTNSNLELKNMFGQFMKMNTASSLGSRTLPCNTITNPKEDLKGITTRSGIAYKGPTIPTTFSLPKVVERETEVTKDTVPPANNGSTKDVQPPVVQVKTQVPNSEPVVALVVEPVEAPVSAPNPNPKPSIPYPSRIHDQKLREKANDQMEIFFQIFQDLNFNISFADALILMPKFASTIKILLTNKEKLFKLAKTPLNEHCSAILLKKLPKKLGDPDKFLILCDFLGIDECLAMANLGASINLMPLSVWNKFSLPKLSLTCMTLELADRSISRLVGVAEDVSIKVGKFHFPTDFEVVDFDADPRVLLILWRSFLKTGRALIDVYEGELTLRVGNKAVTFNLDQTYDEYSQEILGFFMSGNPTPSTELIVFISSPTPTPFRDSDFIFEETDAFLAIEDEPISSEIDDSFYDSEGDILLLEEFLNDDPSSSPLPP
nr:reverse transcriptase domain-containing protein [Tanacetum cinerariifolium]